MGDPFNLNCLQIAITVYMSQLQDRGALIGGGLSMDCFTFAQRWHCKIYPGSPLYSAALIAVGDISRQIIIFAMHGHFLAACGG